MPDIQRVFSMLAGSALHASALWRGSTCFVPSGWPSVGRPGLDAGTCAIQRRRWRCCAISFAGGVMLATGIVAGPARCTRAAHDGEGHGDEMILSVVWERRARSFGGVACKCTCAGACARTGADIHRRTDTVSIHRAGARVRDEGRGHQEGAPFHAPPLAEGRLCMQCGRLRMGRSIGFGLSIAPGVVCAAWPLSAFQRCNPLKRKTGGKRRLGLWTPRFAGNSAMMRWQAAIPTGCPTSRLGTLSCVLFPGPPKLMDSASMRYHIGLGDTLCGRTSECFQHTFVQNAGRNQQTPPSDELD